LWFPISRSKPSLVISYCWLNIAIIYLILYHIELSPILMVWILTPYVCCLEPPINYKYIWLYMGMCQSPRFCSHQKRCFSWMSP
jgi:hypothetical protein